MGTHSGIDEIADVRRASSQQLGDLIRRSAARVPDKPALVFRDHSDTFAQLDEAVNRTANALAGRGIVKGDRVAILSRNNRAFVILRFAIARIGAVATLVNFMLNAGDIAYILEHSGARALFCQDALCATAEDALAQLQDGPDMLFSIAHSGTERTARWAPAEPLFEHADTAEHWADVASDEPIQLMYTSGTESRPKGAMLSSAALYSQYVTVMTGGEMTEDAIDLHCLPLFHCAQLDCFLSVDLYLGATSIIQDGADPAEMLATIEREKVTRLFCPPTVWIALLRHPDFETRDLSSLVQGYYGASIMPTPVIEELTSRLPDLRLYNFYGQTEMAPCATILRPEEQLSKLGSAGRPGINVETRVVDDQGDTVAVGEVGEVVHRSPQLICGYYNDPDKTADAFRGGWFYSGDLGRFDDQGYLYIIDRKKDMIKTGGENVASREIEEAIFRHPEISEVAVFGVSHPKWIEAIVATVVTRQGASLTVEEVNTFCQNTLSSFKMPKHIAIVDALPKNPSGKILKRELRQKFSDLFASGN